MILAGVIGWSSISLVLLLGGCRSDGCHRVARLLSLFALRFVERLLFNLDWLLVLLAATAAAPGPGFSPTTPL